MAQKSLDIKGFHRECGEQTGFYGIRTPTFMAYEPPFMPYEPFLLGVGVVFNLLRVTWEHPGDHNHQDFPRSTAIQMGDVLQYKWEAYCDTNGRSTDSVSLSSERRGTKSTAIQMGGVLQYFFEK